MNLYVIGPTRGPKKIGIAKNPERRIRALGTGHSRPLRLLYSCRVPSESVAVDIERRAHWLLRERRMHGEWFDVGARAAIEAVQRAVAENGAGEKASPSVGRPPLKKNVATIVTAIRLPADMMERIDTLAGPNKRGEFIRDAVIRELKRREREAKG